MNLEEILNIRCTEEQLSTWKARASARGLTLSDLVRSMLDELPIPGPILTDAPPLRPLSEQVGGNHYKDMPIQPVEFIHKNGIGFIEGCVIKYCSRWRSKGGLDDLRKARHFLDLLIELEQE